MQPKPVYDWQDFDEIEATEPWENYKGRKYYFTKKSIFDVTKETNDLVEILKEDFPEIFF